MISRALDIYGWFKMEFDCLWVVEDVFEVVVDGNAFQTKMWYYDLDKFSA